MIHQSIKGEDCLMTNHNHHTHTHWEMSESTTRVSVVSVPENVARTMSLAASQNAKMFHPTHGESSSSCRATDESELVQKGRQKVRDDLWVKRDDWSAKTRWSAGVRVCASVHHPSS